MTSGLDLNWNRSLSEMCLSNECVGRKGSLISFRLCFSWKHSHLGRGQVDRDPSRNVHLVRHSSGMHLYQWLFLVDVCQCQYAGWWICGTVVSFSHGKSAELLSSFSLLVWADFHEQLTEECCHILLCLQGGWQSLTARIAREARWRSRVLQEDLKNM